MLKERIYKSLSLEVRDKILRDGSVFLKGLGLFDLDRKAAQEIAGEDGEISILPPANLLRFEYNPEIDEVIFFDSQADRIAANAQASVPFTKEVIKELYAKVGALHQGEYLRVEGFGFFLNKTGSIGFIPDDILAREVNFEFAGQLAIRLNAGKPTYFIPKAPSLEDLLSGLSDVSEREAPQPKKADKAQSEAPEKQQKPDKSDQKVSAEQPSGEVNTAAEKVTGKQDTTDGSTIPPSEEPNKPKFKKSAKPIVIHDIPLFDDEAKERARPKSTPKLTLFNKIAAAASVLILAVIGVYLLNIYGVIQLTEGSRTVKTHPLTETVTPFPRTSGNQGLEIELERSRQDLLRNPSAAGEDQNVNDAGNEEETAGVTALPDNTLQQPLPDSDAVTGSDSQTEQGSGQVQIIPGTQGEIGPAVSGPQFGLTGEMQHFDTRPFGIVLHSLSSEALARQEMEVFTNAGFRATVYAAARPDGSTTWRVSVGQFETVDDAIAAALTLDEPWRSNNFISRLP